MRNTLQRCIDWQACCWWSAWWFPAAGAATPPARPSSGRTRTRSARTPDLDRPDGDAGDAADKFLAALESDINDKGIPALEKLRDAAKANDQKAAQEAVAELQAIDSGDTDKLAVAAGAKGCAN